MHLYLFIFVLYILVIFSSACYKALVITFESYVSQYMHLLCQVLHLYT